MKKSSVLKILLDLFFIVLCGMALLILAVIPFADFTPNFQINGIALKNYNDFYWFILAVGVFEHVVFLMSIFYLRKAVHFMLGRNTLNESISLNLRRSGVLFLVSGGLTLVTMWAKWLYENVGKTTNHFELNGFMFNGLLLIVGVLLLIQSDYILKAKFLKEDNDLTI